MLYPLHSYLNYPCFKHPFTNHVLSNYYCLVLDIQNRRGLLLMTPNFDNCLWIKQRKMSLQLEPKVFDPIFVLYCVAVTYTTKTKNFQVTFTFQLTATIKRSRATLAFFALRSKLKPASFWSKDSDFSQLETQLHTQYTTLLPTISVHF